MESHVAGPDEIRLAIKSLTSAELIRLNRYAQNRIARLGPLAGAYEGHDLLQEAMLSILEEGRRYWRPELVSLPRFLIGAMRSISSNWAHQSATNGVTVPASRLTRPTEEEDDPPDFFDTIATPEAGPEQQLVNNECQTLEEIVTNIEDLVKDNLIASLVLDGMKSGMRGPAIMKVLDITEKELRTAQRMIQRRVEARWPEGLPHVR